MKQSEGLKLLSAAGPLNTYPSVWADLGCGEGFFTRVLAEMLAPESSIIAIDKSNQLLETANNKLVDISFEQHNFITDKLILPKLDGILMANSLHYSNNQHQLIKDLAGLMKENGKFIIVEYDSMSANRWVPYPIDFVNLKKLFENLGYQRIKKLSEIKSLYHSGNIYACSVE